MILYDLTCPDEHCFESWFRNSGAVEKLIKAGQVACPTCGSTKVQKAPMAPMIGKGSIGKSTSDEDNLPAKRTPSDVEAAMEKAAQAFDELRKVVEKNFDHVGERFPEDFSMHVVSEHPRSLYALTKISAEHLCLYYRHAYEVDVAVVRYSAVIGDWQGAPRSLTGQILSAFLDPAMQGRRVVIDDPQLVWSGSQEYVDVRDAARGTIAALHAPAVPSAVYNISSGVKHTFEEFIGLVREVYPAVEVDIRVVPKGAAPAQARPPLDLRLAAQELGFKPLFQMRDTIKDYVSSHA